MDYYSNEYSFQIKVLVIGVVCNFYFSVFALAQGNNESGFGDSNTFALDTTNTGTGGNSGIGDSNTFALDTTNTGTGGDSGTEDSNTFALDTTNTGTGGDSGSRISIPLLLIPQIRVQVGTRASGIPILLLIPQIRVQVRLGHGDSNTFALDTRDAEQNATITGTVYYTGIVTRSAIVSAKDLNGALYDRHPRRWERKLFSHCTHRRFLRFQSLRGRH